MKVNSRPLEAFGQAGSYLAITRTWNDGDKIEVSLPMKTWSEPLLGDDSLAAQMYGPMVLAAVMGEGPKDGPMKIGGYDTRAKGMPPAEAAPVAAEMKVESAAELRFRSGAMAVEPLYRIADQKYGVYWKTA